MVAEASVVSLHAAPEGGVPKPTVPVLSVRRTVAWAIVNAI